MKIASWNVNSIRARLPNALAWLEACQPDVVLLQETKCLSEAFPKEAFEPLGYSSATHGQKTFNGVAILARGTLEDITCGLPTFPEDPQARYIEAVVNGTTRVSSVYVPNGQEVGSEKFAYKLTFLRRLRQHLKGLLSFEEATVIGGDYNIAPEDQDVYDPEAWRGRILCSTAERRHFCSLLHLGYRDAIESQEAIKTAAVRPYTWWDYRKGSWAADKGLRIDHLLLSPAATDRLQKVVVDRAVRGEPKASDHAPIWCTLT